MSKRLTLLLITQSKLARIDVSGGRNPRATGVWSRERFPEESTATRVDAALRLGPKKTGDVWVFSDEFWTGPVHLAPEVAGALDDEELEQAIALEAETYSGISAFESRLGMKRLPKDVTGEQRWWLTQIPQEDWHEADQTVRQFGGKLSGMAHAVLARFPRNLFGDPDTEDRRPWRLHQAFGESTISIKAVGSDIKDVITLGDLKTQRTRLQLQQWCDETADGQQQQQQQQAWITDQPLPDRVDCSGAAVLCLADVDVLSDPLDHDESPAADDSHRTAPPASGESSTLRLRGDAALRVWAETTASALQPDRQGEVTGMPVAVAQKPPMSNQAATLIACGLALLVALGCFGLYSVADRQLADLNAQIDTMNDKKKRLAADTKALKTYEKELAESKQNLNELRVGNRDLTEDLQQAVRLRSFQQTRWLELVSALANANEGGCWVRGLKTHGEKVTVQGLAVSNQDIAVFASNLEDYASPHGWRVHPAQTERNDLNLIEFEVSLDVSDRAVPDSTVGASVARSSGDHTLVANPLETVPGQAVVTSSTFEPVKEKQ